MKSIAELNRYHLDNGLYLTLKRAVFNGKMYTVKDKTCSQLNLGL